MLDQLIATIDSLPQTAQITLAVFVFIILFSIFKKLIKLALTLIIIVVLALLIFSFIGL